MCLPFRYACGLIFALVSSLPLLPSLAAAEAASAAHPQLGQIHKVYMLSMGGGLDQYLANQLTSRGVIEVVTDAKLADAVFTESIGADFEARLLELLPPPPVVEPSAESKGAKQDKAKNKAGETEGPSSSAAPRSSSFSRGRWNLFLVDLKSRAVVWSTHKVPKDRTPAELDRTSERMVKALSDSLGRK